MWEEGRAPWSQPSTAHDGDDKAQTFEVIHPFHPLNGKRFPVVSRWKAWGGDRLLFRDREERVRSLPTAWTNIAPADPFVVLSAGRSFFRVEDLLTLVELIGSLREGEGGEGCVK